MMVIRFHKKNKKFRGSKTHGWGSKKKHRGKGSQGGKGFGGSTKHKRSMIYAKMPWHFGSKGFNSLKKKKRAINVEELNKMKGSEINLAEMGYDILLGKGNIDRAVNVKIEKISKIAKEKIEKAGGKVIE